MKTNLNIIEYTSDALWDAVITFRPSYKEAKEINAIRLPTAVPNSLLAYFVKREMSSVSDNEVVQGNILLKAYIDLNDYGYFLLKNKDD